MQCFCKHNFTLKKFKDFFVFFFKSQLKYIYNLKYLSLNYVYIHTHTHTPMNFFPNSIYI